MDNVRISSPDLSPIGCGICASPAAAEADYQETFGGATIVLCPEHLELAEKTGMVAGHKVEAIRRFVTVKNDLTYQAWKAARGL